MHPILARRERLLAYLAAWLPLVATLSYLLHVASPLTPLEAAGLAVPLCVVFAFLSLSSWYLCRSAPPTRSGLARLAATHGIAALVASALWVAGAVTVVAFLSEQPGQSQLLTSFTPAIPTLFAFGVLVHALVTALHNVLWLFEAGQEAERRALEARMLAGDAELKALRAQVNPHFLFNALNSVAALTGSEPERARETCMRLSELLRRSLGLEGRQTLPLSEELAMARDYLAIERVRFGSRLLVEEKVEEAAGPVHIPTLLLMPLIENAITHGVGTLLDGGTVKVEARAGGDTLLLSIENPFDPEAGHRAGAGIGLANVRRRLAARYGERASLKERKEGATFRVEVTLPAGAPA